jgi:poly(beta-D-mannuronate) C5 epimerase
MVRTYGRSMARRNRPAGYLISIIVVLSAALICTFVLGRTYSELALKKEPFNRLAYVQSFDPIEDVTLGLSPNTTDSAAGKPIKAIHAIKVLPSQTILLAGGKAVRVINKRAPRTLRGLAKLIDDKHWITESSTTITLNAAVIVGHGCSMTIAAPVTSGLVLTVRPGVFLAADQGKIVISGVYVRASNTNVPDTFSSPSREEGRPFLLASQNSVMVIKNSTFKYLGRDWNSSYGLTWSKGSTGSVNNSIFDHNFIGVYSNASSNLQVIHDQFYYNSLYGVDPHSGSTHLLIEYNTSDYNGRHGIIFSNHVTDSIVQYNVAEGNGLNGIMMDEASANNVIRENIVADNHSDGIVIANSSSDVVADNRVSGNRVGITIRGDTTDTKISGNTITANKMASQNAGLSQNTAYGNGGEWSWRRIEVIWLGALALLLVLLSVTKIMKPRLNGNS